MDRAARIRQATAATALALGILAPAGCGPKKPATAPVAGRVLLDGRPVADAAVLFQPVAGGVPARGGTDAEGRFRLSTFARDDGALVGRHRVLVSKVVGETVAANDLGLEAAPAPAAQPKAVLPPRYADPATTSLEATVEPQGTTIDLTLESGN
jgi:hypothetical protein